MALSEHQKAIAAYCLRASYDGSLNFPEIVLRLIEAGFESYAIDFRRHSAIYYLPSGESCELPFSGSDVQVAGDFQNQSIKDAILEAQSGSASYSYKNFCEKVMRAGCAGYVVSFSGKRAVYFGRTAETHVEHFPN